VSVLCPFCSPTQKSIRAEWPLVVALRDHFPVSEGHALVVTRRHVETFFDATAAERAEIWAAVAATKEQLDRELSPDGYNVGFNTGRAAGQTVMHLHVHVIPRRSGDVADPRGGVRGVIPEKRIYEP
jgi:diadenosine tetraphosphate (Ap4A) HIT family hydrolase